MSLTARALEYHAGGHALLKGVSLTLEPGCVHAVLGPNGAGKSTLLKLLAGDLTPSSGEIALNGKPLQAWSQRERAQLRAVLPQSETLRFGFTAEQVVKLGRLSSGQHDPQTEERIVREALEAADVAQLAQRGYPSLSGGERARVQFARVMAQVWMPTKLGERYLLLDEPTASLDFAHQHGCMAAAKKLSRQNLGVLAVLHDPNLALAYADKVTVLLKGEVTAEGAPQDVLTPPVLERVYGVGIELLHSQAGQPYIAVRP